MFKEYEYSSQVNDIKPFLEYCEKNVYKKEDEYNQIRTLYKNNDKLLARVTKNESNGKEKIFFDLQDENESKEVLKVLRESGTIEVTNNTEFVDSMLGMLNFKFHKELKRKRYVYFKDGVKFEIDSYTQPNMNVAAIEGDKEKVDKVYNEVKKYFEC